MKKLLILLTAALLITFTPARSQNTVTDTFDISQTNKNLDKIISRLNSQKSTNKEISDFLQTLGTIQDKVNIEKNALSSMLDNIQKKINALGPAPEKDNAEPAEIARQRKEFTRQADGYKAQITQTDLIKAKIEEINTLIVKLRNQTLLENILTKQSSIFHPEEFWTSLVSFAKFGFNLIKSPLYWYNELSSADRTVVNNNIIIVCTAMLTSLVIAVYLSLYIKKWFGYKQNIEKPNYTQKFRAAIAMLIARGVIPAAVIGAFLLWLKNTPVINNGSFGLLLQTVAFYLLWYYIAKAVVKVVFTPFNGKWRIIEVCDDKAKKISSALIFSVAAVCCVSFFLTLAAQMSSEAEIVYSLQIFANAVKAFCVILVTRRFLYDADDINLETLREDEEIIELSASSKISLLITFIMIVSFSASLFGYIRLSAFVINRFIISMLTIGTFYILGKLIRVLFHQLLLFRFWISIFRINRRTLVKTEFWFGLILTPVLGVVCILSLLAVWGASVDILINNVSNFLVGFNIGGVHISITSILLGIVSFFISMFLFKMLKNSFERGSLSKIEMEEGVKNSVTALISFIGFIFSCILAIAVMGGSLSSITIIAGTLSFGAGLGLQNMVSNLVAGITILFERPIKIGDWVIINNYEGIVKQINMRSTELETWNKSHVIIPNSDILSKSLVNLTYNNRMSRIEIKVGVDYNSDIELVKKTLLEIADETPDTLKTPAPNVSFSDLGGHKLNFQLNCYTANIYNRSAISNSIREKIVTRFRRLGIVIP